MFFVFDLIANSFATCEYLQPRPSSPAPNAQEQLSSASAEQSSQAVSIPAQNTSSGDGLKSTGRKELPMVIAI